MHSEKSNYIIGGDINLSVLKYQIDTHITDYVNSILSFGCISLINKPTRFSSTHQPSLLDHIYTNIIDDNITTGIALIVDLTFRITTCRSLLAIAFRT